MAGVLLDNVEQDALQRRRGIPGPALAGLAGLVEVMAADDLPAALRARVQRGEQAIEGLIRRDVPAVIAPVAPRVGDGAPLEAPLQPAQLDEREVLDQFQRCPAGGQAAGPQFAVRQRADLGGQPVPEVVEVAQENLGARAGRGRRCGKWDAHETSLKNGSEPMPLAALFVRLFVLRPKLYARELTGCGPIAAILLDPPAILNRSFQLLWHTVAWLRLRLPGTSEEV